MNTLIASFDVDAQKGFTPICPNELPVEGGDKIVDQLNKNAQYADIRVGSKDAHPSNAVWNTDEKHPILSPIEGNYKNVDIHWNSHCVSGTIGCELLEGLPHPQDYDFFVWKGIERDMHPYGACYHDLNDKMSTGVIEFLKSKNVKTIIVGGLATDYCVFKTVMQLKEAGFKIILNLAACEGIAEDSIENALNTMKENNVIMVESYLEIKDYLS